MLGSILSAPTNSTGTPTPSFTRKTCRTLREQAQGVVEKKSHLSPGAINHSYRRSCRDELGDGNGTG